ncbi:MAG: lipid II:glycine glycyltransferase FemX, partial [Actinocrinis sp.]
GSFALRMGPPVVDRVWSNTTIRDGLAAPGVSGFAALDPDRRDSPARDLTQRLSALGWHRVEADTEGFGSGQPRYHVRLPLDGRDEKSVWDGMSAQWRRNIRIAQRSGVTVEQRGAESLPEFHRLYLATAARDGFLPRQLPYFEQMFRSFDGEDPDRVKLYVAQLDGEPLAAATLVRVGSFAWFGYGACADHTRDARPSNALQWQMIRDCLDQGIRVYDLRGVPGTLDTDDRRSGPLRFKAGTGAQVVEYVGEWDLPLHRAFYRVFRLRTSWR